MNNFPCCFWEARKVSKAEVLGGESMILHAEVGDSRPCGGGMSPQHCSDSGSLCLAACSPSRRTKESTIAPTRPAHAIIPWNGLSCVGESWAWH